MRSTRRHRFAGAVVAATVALGLTGCVGTAAMPTPTTTPSTSASASPSNDSAPVLRPGESAVANRQFFDSVNTTWHTEHGKSDGRAIIDNLVAHGFVKQDMEVTFDYTPTNRLTDSIVYAVKISDECLVAQFGPNGYTSSITTVLGTGTCLVGHTRPIDW
jgi:hypothetical protein